MDRRQEVPSKLAVLLHADVVDSTALVRENESLAHRRIRDGFDRFAEIIAAHDGTALEIRGDALVAEFSKASDAVNAAWSFQQSNRASAAECEDDAWPRVRVGIAAGEVVIADGTVTGEGIVLAQRLEQLAGPHGICLQDAVRQILPGRLPFDYEDLGEQVVKGFDKPVRAFRVKAKSPTLSPLHATAKPKADEPLPLPDKPSIVVLPFVNMSADPDQEYFSDGISEDILTALSYFSGLFVIARNSSFAYKGQAVDVRRVADELGARYVLEGSVRRGGERVRITAQLIDAQTAHHVWAEKFDRKLEDIFDLQDEITLQIAGALQPQVHLAEQRRSIAKKPENLDAWDYYLRGLAAWHEYSKPENIDAREMFEKALERDPSFSRPYSMVALTYTVDLVQEHGGDRDEMIAAALESARRAVALDDEDSTAHVALAAAYRFTGQHDLAVAEARRAVELNPSDALAYFMLGNLLDLAGSPHEAIPHVETALRLSPRDPRAHIYVITLARIYLNARHYEAAVARSREVQRRWSNDPRAYVVHAISLAQLGRLEEARASLDECERLDPGFAEKWVRNRNYRKPDDEAHLIDGWDKARAVD